MDWRFTLIMLLLCECVRGARLRDDSEESVEHLNRASHDDHEDHEECHIPRVDTSPSKLESINVAQDAAMEAAAAREAQRMAGCQAAHQIKLQLAERAEEAARTAEAAFLAKQAIVEELEQMLREAKFVSHEELENLQDERRTLESAIHAAQEAQNELLLLQNAVKLSRLNLENAIDAAKGAHTAVEDKEKILEAAKVRAEEIMRELKMAEEELAATKHAAERAIAAAREAQMNIDRDVKFKN